MVAPDAAIPRESDIPAVTAVHDVVPETATGELTLVRLALPSWPEVLRPHPYAAPVVVIPREKYAPPATAVQLAPGGPETNTGDKIFADNEFMPACPDVFCPHPYKRPAEVIPSECDAPAAIADHEAPAGPDTNTGDDTVVTLEEFMPSSPVELSPHPYSTPVVVMASE